MLGTVVMPEFVIGDGSPTRPIFYVLKCPLAEKSKCHFLPTVGKLQTPLAVSQ